MPGRLRALEQLDVLGLELGDALVVLGALLDHVGQAARALVQILADVVDRLAHGQQHLAEALILGLPRDQLLFDAAEAGKFLAHLGDAAAERLAVAQPRALGFALALQPRLGLLVEHHDHFVLELLQRLLDLREARQAGPAVLASRPSRSWMRRACSWFSIVMLCRR